MSIHTSEQDHVIISLVQHIFTEEEAANQSSQCISIFIRRTNRVFLSLKKMLDIIIQRFLICYLLCCKHMNGPIQSQNYNSRYIIPSIYLIHRSQSYQSIRHLIFISWNMMEFIGSQLFIFLLLQWMVALSL